MKLITTALYSFNELTTEAKQTAINNMLDNEHWHGDHVGDECRNTLEAFCELFNARSSYSMSAYSHSNVSISSNLDTDVLELKGVKLINWITKNTVFLDRKPRLFASTSGQSIRASKVLFEDHTRADDCCLTGVCYDVSICKEFLFFAEKGFTLEECLDRAADEFCRVWQKELEYYASEKYAMEYLTEGEQNEIYTINGEEF